ncbi:MAG: hypothetical protein OMOMHJEC_01292 [Xanthomonadales bacterium]|nr:hypothetical protein [Xanthomonadales bacterium]
MDTVATRTTIIRQMTASPEPFSLAGALRRAFAYALITLPMFALWELAHVRLYTIWVDAGPDAAWRAALHCSLGDAVIAVACALAAALLARALPWLARTHRTDAVIVALGLLTTIAIEWISTRWLGRWAYREIMPVDPILGIGLSPLAQWIVVPVAALWILRRRSGPKRLAG